MTTGSFSVRRATVDDLPALRQLWSQAQLPGAALEPRITDFQLVQSADGTPVGALGLRLEGKQGLVHSEGYVRPDLAAQCRALLWERMQTVARNHGLTRLWIGDRSLEGDGRGFVLADAEALGRLPKPFGEPGPHWRTLRLREESAEAVSLDHEFEIFQQAQREATERMMKQARFFKAIAWIVLALFAVLLLALGVNSLLKAPPATRSRP